MCSLFTTIVQLCLTKYRQKNFSSKLATSTKCTSRCRISHCISMLGRFASHGTRIHYQWNHKPGKAPCTHKWGTGYIYQANSQGQSRTGIFYPIHCLTACQGHPILVKPHAYHGKTYGITTVNKVMAEHWNEVMNSEAEAKKEPTSLMKMPEPFKNGYRLMGSTTSPLTMTTPQTKLSKIWRTHRGRGQSRGHDANPSKVRHKNSEKKKTKRTSCVIHTPREKRKISSLEGHGNATNSAIPPPVAHSNFTLTTTQ